MNEMPLTVWVAGIILVVTFVGIFTEQLHGISRVKFAVIGAGAVVIAGQYLGFYSPTQALLAIDWNVIFLLAIMMAIVSIMVSTGGFEAVALFIAKKSAGSQLKLFLMLGLTIGAISMLLDNVTTVIIFGPLLILICRTMGVSPVPYLLSAAIFSNIGGVATLIGDPPNLMIGSVANIDFNTFLVNMGPPVLLVTIGTGLGALLLFRNELMRSTEQAFYGTATIRNKLLWVKSLFAILLMIILFIFQKQLNWQPWFIAGVSLIFLVCTTKSCELENLSGHIEMPILVFFIALFILIGGVEESGLLAISAEKLEEIIKNHSRLSPVLLLWISAIFSAFIDNIPFTAAMIPVLTSLDNNSMAYQDALWWALALGVGIGGNASHIGATANVYIVSLSEKLAKETGNPGYVISPLMWLRKGVPLTLVALVVCSAYLWLRYDPISH